MPTVGELTSKNISNALTNVKTWGGIVANVKEYGAKGDGITDDSSSFQEAINTGFPVLSPPGNYFLNANLTKTLGTTDDFVLIGSGAEVSTLIFGDGFGIVVNGAAESNSEGDKNSIRIKNLGIETLGAGTSKGIQFIGGSTGVGSGTNYELSISELRLSGNTTGKYWSEGIYAENFTFSDFRDILFQGDGTNGTAFRLHSTLDAVDNTFRNIRVHRANTAFYITGRLEGVYIHNLIALSGIQYGVRWEATLNAGEFKQPLLILSNSHINTELYGIKTVDISQTLISDSLIYVSNTTGVSKFGVHMSSTNATANSFNQISRVTMIGIGSRSGALSTGVYVDGNTKYSNIDAIIDNFNTGVDTVLGVGTYISPGTRVTNFDTRTTNTNALGTAFTSGGLVNVDGAYQHEDVSGTSYIRDMARERLRVGTYVHTVVSTTSDTVDITIPKAFDTDTIGLVVSIGNNADPATVVQCDLANSTATTIRVYVKNGVASASVRINYIVYGY